MIPDTFHIYKSKEEKDLVTSLRDAEYWNTKRNGLFSVLGITLISFYKPQQNKPNENITFCEETEKIMVDIDKKIKSCQTGNCEL